MDIPDLVKQSLGDEEIQAGVSLGDEDAVCLTPTRTLVYRGEGLLSDEQVESYSHDIEQLAISEGRRKTKFTMQYIEGTESFTVPANRGEKVLKLFLEGVLRLEGVIEPRESLAGVYRFSELTLIIAEGRVVKHIGNQVWTEDYEVYPYEDVTELSFERASVATSIALTVDGRPQRIKVPNDQARVVQQTLEQALFDYYDVGTLEELNRAIATEETAAGGEADGTADARESDDGFTFGDDFDPLVSDDEEDLTESVDAQDQLATDAATGDSPQAQSPHSPGGEASQSTDSQPNHQVGQTSNQHQPDQQAEPVSNQQPTEQPGDQPGQPTDTSTEPDVDTGEASSQTSQQGGQQSNQSATASQPSSQPSPEPAEGQQTPSESDGAETDPRTATDASDVEQKSAETGAAEDAESVPVSRAEYEAMAERLDELTEAVDRQNELLKRQHRALKQLVKQQQETE